MIPLNVKQAVLALANAVTAAAPLKSAGKLQVAALKTQSATCLTVVDAALAAAAGNLDAGDPTGYPGDMVTYLEGLETASVDQSNLSDMRGLVGRAAFNLAQVPA